MIVVTGLARFVQAPEIKATSAGKVMAKGSIAWDSGFGDKKESHFIDYIAWEPLAIRMQKFVSKGGQFFVLGDLKQEKWEKEGQKKSKMSITLRDLKSVGNAKSDEPRIEKLQPENIYSDDEMPIF